MTLERALADTDRVREQSAVVGRSEIPEQVSIGLSQQSQTRPMLYTGFKLLF